MLIAILLLVVDHRYHSLKTVRSVLSTIVVPIQHAVVWPAQLLMTMRTNLTSRRALLEENGRLHTENILLKARQQKGLALEQENNQLRILLKAAPRLGNNRVVVAELLAINSDPFVHEFVLDKGSSAGVYLNQPVLDASGIIGQVIEVSPMSSRVLLVSDMRSAVPIQNIRTGNRGIVVGTGNLNSLGLQNVPITADVRVGDVLVSSGLDGHYPAGYPMGTVAVVQNILGERYAAVSILPSAQLNRSQQVLLIWPATQSRSATSQPIVGHTKLSSAASSIHTVIKKIGNDDVPGGRE